MASNDDKGINNAKSIEKLKDLQEEIEKTQQKYSDSFVIMQESAKEYQEKMKANNPYAEANELAA